MRQTLAWAAPLGVVALVTGGAAYTAAASASPDLEERTAAEVLALMAESDVERLSGTIRTDADLGLPELPEGLALPGPSADPDATGAPTGDADPSATAGSDASPAAVLGRLLSGENTLSVWVDGPGERFRADLDDPVAGATVVRDGDSVSLWSATEPDTVVRFTAPEGEGADEPPSAPAPGPEDLTPQEMAERFVAEADPSTEIRVDDTTVVAGRDAYVLVADPRDGDTLVDRIVLAVDGETGLPLRFQVFAVDQRRPAFQTGFTDIEFAAPADSAFDEAFPPGATVREETLEGPADLGLDGVPGLEGLEGMDGLEKPGDLHGFEEFEGRHGMTGADPAVEVVGEGWSAVAVLGEPGRGPAGATDAPTGEATSPGEAEARAAFDGLFQQVDGGRAIRTALVSVLLADDGRVLVGSVPVERLVEVAAG